MRKDNENYARREKLEDSAHMDMNRRYVDIPYDDWAAYGIQQDAFGWLKPITKKALLRTPPCKKNGLGSLLLVMAHHGRKQQRQVKKHLKEDHIMTNTVICRRWMEKANHIKGWMT